MQFPTQTQFIKRDSLETIAIPMAWVFGVIVPFLASALGNYIAFSGGSWDGFSLRTLDGSVILYALAWQVASTCAQLAFKSRAKSTGKAGWWIAYVISLMVSVVPSIAAYSALVSARLIEILIVRMAAQAATLVAGGFIAVVCVLTDMLPEWIAVG